MTILKETTTLVPSIVLKHAKELYKIGSYKSALELLEDNKIEFDIYTDHIIAKFGKRVSDESFHIREGFDPNYKKYGTLKRERNGRIKKNADI